MWQVIIFDFIGTLTDLVGYSLDESTRKLFDSLLKKGYEMSYSDFLKAYGQAHDKFREIRYKDLVEVTNSVWISEAMNILGFTVSPDHEDVSNAVNNFFEDYVTSLKLRVKAKEVVQEIHQNFRLGLVSNFTHAPVIYKALNNLAVSKYFNTILVSGAVGWRKPNPKIFREAQKDLGVEAHDAIFVGDTPLEDIAGAQNVGMKTVFIESQFNKVSDLEKTGIKPDYIIENLSELLKILKS